VQKKEEGRDEVNKFLNLVFKGCSIGGRSLRGRISIGRHGGILGLEGLLFWATKRKVVWKKRVYVLV